MYTSQHSLFDLYVTPEHTYVHTHTCTHTHTHTHTHTPHHPCIQHCLHYNRVVETTITHFLLFCKHLMSFIGSYIHVHVRTYMDNMYSMSILIYTYLSGDKTEELPYMVMLNSTLPEDIRVLSWAPVGRDFSARFNCLHRTYKYFFPRGSMNIEVS